MLSWVEHEKKFYNLGAWSALGSQKKIYNDHSQKVKIAAV